MVTEKKNLKIIWTRTAERQLFHVLEYWINKNKSPRYAEKLSDLVWNHTFFLSQNPYASTESNFPDIRRASLGPFSLFFKVYQNELLIMAFWDNRQDPEKLRNLLLSS